MSPFRFPLLFTALILAVLAGCGEGTPPDEAHVQPAPAAAVTVVETAASVTILPTKPDQALSITAAKSDIVPGAPIVVHGRIGGRREPFIEGKSAFLLADPAAIKACDANPDDACKYPWDFCCAGKEAITAATCLIQVRDDSGIKNVSLLDVGGMKPGSFVVVQGAVAASSTADNLIIDANGIFVDHEQTVSTSAE